MAGLQLLGAALAAIAMMLLFVGLGRLIEPQESVRERIDALSPLPTSAASVEPTSGSTRLRSLLAILNKILPRRASSASLATELARANLPLTASEYVLVTIAGGLLLFLLVLVLLRQVLFALPAGLLGLFLPRVYVQGRQAKRLLAFQEQLPDILTMLVGSLRSGYGITIAMDTVAKQMPPPASEEFSRVVREVGLGIATAQALANLVQRVRSDDLDLMVTAIVIQYEVGGNLASILETISGTIRERVRLKGQLRVLTAQQGLQRTILTGLPVVLGVVVYMLNPAYMSALFSPPWLLIPGVAAALVGVGYLVMGKLGQIEF